MPDVGAEIFRALLPVIISDLPQRTSRFNVTLGAVSAAFGLGAARTSYSALDKVNTSAANIA